VLAALRELRQEATLDQVREALPVLLGQEVDEGIAQVGPPTAGVGNEDAVVAAGEAMRVNHLGEAVLRHARRQVADHERRDGNVGVGVVGLLRPHCPGTAAAEVRD